MKILRNIVVIFIITSIGVIGIGCTENKDVDIKVNNKEVNVDNNAKEEKGHKEDVITLKEVEENYNGRDPKEWGEKVTGVLNHINTNDKVVFLTFDACGGTYGNDYDKELIEYLKKEGIEATLFINSRWIDSNKDIFNDLARNNLFSIQNHGTLHKPLSVNGREVYKIKGTNSVKEVYDEISGNDAKIKELTGKKPKLFRSGTAYYDDISVKIAKDLGYEIGGFDVLGDAGATFSKEQIIKQGKTVKNGSILIYHMNKPKGETFEGVKVVIENLKKAGYSFKKIEDYV
ncbi:polysaccharide deacetylase family protein [Clostridium sardiniense]|uniref:Polysaccharide deacetylase family protein n=1 Tax=Clostridium sardiniense TaxID=29369 RepID=A0ABS7KUL8_CLOSR|nr:polysaccharide deacetylase family protein [Clostridium sardiniense]MBY0754509.1 polysaccharide deacetylase family protein [Clostridium sardiniense]MDQ0461950.1 peptidoglycan/xylan/chitin deacetylase (PgdA/CDA1 family) [Clostridium sardiniense]